VAQIKALHVLGLINQYSAAVFGQVSLKTGKIFVMAVTLGLLGACAPMSPYEAVDSPAVRKTVENARTPGDHAALVTYFENLAAEMRIKAEEQRQLLQHFQEKSYLYGRQAQDRQSHTWALMNRYERAAKASMGKAASHRRLAAGIEQDEGERYAATGAGSARTEGTSGTSRTEDAGTRSSPPPHNN
jgi:hypothetical protein